MNKNPFYSENQIKSKNSTVKERKEKNKNKNGISIEESLSETRNQSEKIQNISKDSNLIKEKEREKNK
jgi:hypothetical protein